MALDEKARHRKLEARRARRRRRIAERTPELVLSPLASTKQMKSVDRRRLKAAQKREERAASMVQAAVDGAERFTWFFLEVSKYNRAQAKAEKAQRAERHAQRAPNLQRPLTMQPMELVKLGNGMEYRRQRRVVKHRWRPVAPVAAPSLMGKLFKRRASGASAPV